MARYNEILSPRYNRMLTKLFSMKGEAPAPQLAPDIQPVLPHFSGNENRVLEGWHRYGFGARFQQTAAQNTAFQIRNPVGSRIIVVIELLLVFTEQPATVFINIGQNAADLTNLFSGFRLDGRIQNVRSNAIVSQMYNSAVPAGTASIAALNSQITAFALPMFAADQELVLAPGDVLYMDTSTTVNVTMVVSNFWRERPLEESELAL